MGNRDSEHREQRTGTHVDRRSFLKGSAGAIIAAGVCRPSGPRLAGGVSTRKIRMGVVGGNFGATFWWHEHPNAVVTAVTDLREDRRKRLRDR